MGGISLDWPEAMNVKKFYEPVFHAHVIFVTECGPEDVEAYIAKRFKGEKVCLSGFEGMAFACTDRELTFYIVWIRGDIKEAKQFYSLIHETLHMVEWIFKDRGIDFKGEPACYYQEYWVRRFWRHICNREEVNKMAKAKALFIGVQPPKC